MNYVRITEQNADGSYRFEELEYDGHGLWRTASLQEVSGKPVPIGTIAIRKGKTFDCGISTDNVMVDPD